MAKNDVRIYIHRKKRNTHSTDDQVQLAHHLWKREYLPKGEGVTRREAEELCESTLKHSVKTCLQHLEEIDIVEASRKPGPDTFVIADWKDEDEGIVNGEVDEAAAEAIEALIDHVQDQDPAHGDDSAAVADGAGATFRRAVAEGFDLEAESLEGHLRTGDQVERLNQAVEVIEDHNEFSTRDEYGRIQFIRAPYEYRLTCRAVDLYEQ
jgi:hypothetical protein